MTPQDNTPELKWSVLKVLTVFEVVCAEGINSAGDIIRI